MDSTIGEIVNELLPYSHKIEVSKVGDFPCLKAYLMDGRGFTQSILQVLQVDRGKYSVCETRDETFYRYIPNPSIDKPFILERELILKRRLEKDEEIVHRLSRKEFLEYLFQLLTRCNIIKIGLTDLNRSINEFSFIGNKTKRVFENVRTKGHKFPTLRELLAVIRDNSCKIEVSSVRDRDLKKMRDGFSNLGVTLIINGNIIREIKLDLKYQEKIEYRSK